MYSPERRGEKEAHNFECMGDDADSHELLAVVTTIHHEGVREALDDRAIGFTEALNGITTGGVRDVDWRAYLDVVTVEKARSVRASTSQRFKATVADKLHPSPEYAYPPLPRKIQALCRVLTLMRCLGLRRPRMTIC